MPGTAYSEDLPPMKSEDMTHDLVRLPQVLRRLAQQPLEWQPLAQALVAISPAEKVPTGKQFQQELGLSPAKFRRWLDALYAAYLHLLETDADTVPYPLVEHQLIVTGARASQVFCCRLPVTPRVGEDLQLDFLRAVTGDSAFYVDSITHDFSDGRYAVLVYLKAGYYNGHRHALLERARFEETLSHHAQFRAPDYLLNDFLRKRYPPPPESEAAYELREQAEARYGRDSYYGRRSKKRRSRT